MSNVLGPMLAALPTCTALTTASTCAANAECSWASLGGECGPNLMKLLLDSVPAGCPLRPVLQKTASCEHQSTQSACSENAACRWEAVAACQDSALQTQSKCSVSMAEVMGDLAVHGSSDAAAVVNAAMVAESCGAKADEASCAGASVTLVKAAPTGDAISGSRPRVAIARAAELVALIFLVAAAWAAQE